MLNKAQVTAEMIELAIERRPTDARTFMRELGALANLPAHRITRLEALCSAPATTEAVDVHQTQKWRTELDDYKLALDRRKEQLDTQETELKARDAELMRKENQFDVDANELVKRATSLDEREAALLGPNDDAGRDQQDPNAAP